MLQKRGEKERDWEGEWSESGVEEEIMRGDIEKGERDEKRGQRKIKREGGQRKKREETGQRRGEKIEKEKGRDRERRGDGIEKEEREKDIDLRY